MIFVGLAKKFSLQDDEQYNTIGNFWDEMSLLYGMENLQGLGYKWEDSMIFYAIGLKNGKIDQANIKLELPDDNWFIVEGETKNLKSIYDEIYVDGPLKYEIEIFFENGMCQIKYYR